MHPTSTIDQRPPAPASAPQRSQPSRSAAHGLDAQLQLTSAALRVLAAPVSIVDLRAADQPLVFVNEAFCRLTGYAQGELLGRNCRLLQQPGTDPAALADVRAAISAGQPATVLLRNRRRDGSLFWNALRLVPLALDGGPITHFVGFQQDVSEWLHGAAAPHALDPRAAAAARASFEQRLGAALRAGVEGRQRHVLLALAGAESSADGKTEPLPLALRLALMERLQVRTVDDASLCFMDDGLLAVLAPLRHDETAGQLAERLCERIAPLWPFHAGLAESPEDGSAAADWLAAAHAAQRQAAMAGLPGPGYGSPSAALRDQRRRMLLRDAAGALGAGQWQARYQPVVDLATGRVLALTATPHWLHPALGEVASAEAQALLGRLPVMRAVAEWLLDDALGRLAEWDREPGRPLRMSIGVSVGVLMTEGFVAHVRGALERHHLGAQQLELSLPERALAEAGAAAAETLRELRRHGVLVQLSNVGNAHAGLGDLGRLPADALQIDPQLIAGSTQSRTAAALCRVTVELARGLGLRCLAPALEQAGQQRFFTDLRCQEGQGDLFAAALTPEQASALLAANQPYPVLGTSAPAGAEPVRHLLILDDEDNVLRALRRTLRPAGFQIHITTTPEAAFEVLAQHPVGVVLADQRMPTMTGSEFLRRVKDLHPQTRRIVLSGYTDLQSITDAINQGAIYKFLTKPWNDAELLAQLQTAFAEFELAADHQRLRMELQNANHRLAAALDAQGERLSHGETALDVMHAAIGSVAVPVLGLDTEGDLVMINAAAERLFADDMPRLGEPLGTLLGCDLKPCSAGPDPRHIERHGRHYAVRCTPMQTGSRQLGLLLTLVETCP